MSIPSEDLSGLSCARCRNRKVRCNRVLPQCGRCSENSVECVYPSRKKRRPNRTAGDFYMPPSSNEALHGILDRLRRLEAQSTTSPSPASPIAAVLGSTPNPASLADHGSYATPTTQSSLSLGADRAFDVHALMQDATDRVQKLRLRNLRDSLINDPINIPRDLAKQRISNYFSRKPAYLWTNVVDKELIELMPDIVGRPRIHVDPVILVIYYCILYNECAFSETPSSNPNESEIIKSCYIGCTRSLQLWQREASGSLSDFIAALCITKVAAEFYDFDLAWQMFKLACEYCQGLNLHNLDDLPQRLLPAEEASNMSPDEKRKDMWEVIMIDLFFRLIYDMPAAITNNPWKINLPWLAPDSSPLPEGIGSVVFLTNSKVTLILARFFAMLDEDVGTDKFELMTKAEGLCREVEAAVAEWSLFAWLATTSNDGPDTWLVADALLTGYTSIIHILRKASLHNTSSLSTEPPWSQIAGLNLSQFSVAINAARHIINGFKKILVIFPRAECMVALFGAYQCYLPFAILANNILGAEDPLEFEEDIKTLESFASQAAILSRGHSDIMPLIHAMQTVNAEIQGTVDDFSGNY